VEMDNEPFDFKLLFKNPETVKYIDAVAKGKLDLANVTKFVKLPSDTKLAGFVWADVFAKGNMEAIASLSGRRGAGGEAGDFTAGGFLDIKNLFYSSKD